MSEFNTSQHNTLEAAREWLRMAGLKLDPDQGWIDATPNGTRVGWIAVGGPVSSPIYTAVVCETEPL